MARGNTIIVGGGISPSTPFTTGNIPVVVNTTPATVADSILRQTTPPAGGAIVVGASDVAGAAPTETFRTVAGIISECVITGTGAGSNADSARLGRGNTITGVGGSCTFTGGNILIGGLALVIASGGGLPNVVIGYNASCKTTGTGNAHGAVILGANATANAASHSGHIVIGSNASGTGNPGVIIGQSTTSSAAGVYIGKGITATGTGVVIGEAASTTSSTVVVIGASASIGSTSTSGVCIGDSSGIGANSTRSIAIGTAANVTGGHVNAIVIGSNVGASAGSNTCIIGSGTNSNITTFVLGGPTSTSTVALLGNVLIRMTNAITTANLTAGSLTLQPGLGTGNAAQPSLILSIGDAVAGSSSTLATPFNAVTVSNNTTTVTTRFDSIAASTKNVLLSLTTAGTDRCYIGVVGAAGGLVAGSAVGETVIRTQTQRLLFSLDGGATLHADFTAAGILELNVDRGLRMNNATSSAAAQVGTLNNAPTAGNPGFWLKINIAGTNYAIPCWLG